MQKHSDSISQKHAPPGSGYPGGKGAGGVAEAIIRQMPPHVHYVELFGGHASVFRAKRPAQRNTIVEIDRNVCDWLRSTIGGTAGTEIICQDAVDWLIKWRWTIKQDWLICLDPPYLFSTRSGEIYAHEYGEEIEHRVLLEHIRHLGCMVMISGYSSKLYDELLHDWRCVTIPAMTRGGARFEKLWCNFTEPTILHDPRFAGRDYRQRENHARKAKRFAAKISQLDHWELQLLAEALVSEARDVVKAALQLVPAQLPVSAATDASADKRSTEGGAA